MSTESERHAQGYLVRLQEAEKASSDAAGVRVIAGILEDLGSEAGDGTPLQRQAKGYLETLREASEVACEADSEAKLADLVEEMSRDAGVLPAGTRLRDIVAERGEGASLREVRRYATGERSTNPTIGGGLLEHVYGPDAREDLELAR